MMRELGVSIDGNPAYAAFSRALVTGCAGFIGSHLTESLLDAGCEVVGVDCYNDNYDRALKTRNVRRAREWVGFEFAPIDLSSGGLGELVAHCDVIFHLAAEPGVRSSWGPRFERYLRNNLAATQQLLNAAREVPDRPFVYASSSSVYGDAERLPTGEEDLPRPYSPYGVTKLAAEHLCQAYHRNHGVSAVCLRYFSVYGPRQRPDMAFNRFFRAALLDETITVFGDGTQSRDFTYVDDIVRATVSAAGRNDLAGAILNIGGGVPVSVNETLDLVAALRGRPLRVLRLSSEHGDVKHTCAATGKALAALGFAPRVAITEGLTHEFNWMKDELDQYDVAEPSVVATPSPGRARSR